VWVMGIEEYGGSNVLKSMEMPEPILGRSEVLVRVAACGVNHVDLDIRSGVSRLPIVLPHVLGLEPVGVIEQVGMDVSHVSVGDSVAVIHQVSCNTCRYCVTGQDQLCTDASLFGVHRYGGYASHVVAPAASVVVLPDETDLCAVAASQTTVSTAWHALRVRTNVMPGDLVLINAAGSGVGTAAIQVARLLGARVIASAGSDEKLANARRLGAVETVNYRSERLSERIRMITGGGGVNVILDCVGGDVLEQSMASLAPNGAVVTVGAHAGEVVPTDIISLFRNQRSLIGSVRATQAEIRHSIDLVARGVVAPSIAAVLPMERAGEAHDMLSERKVFGRVVLTNSWYNRARPQREPAAGEVGIHAQNE